VRNEGELARLLAARLQENVKEVYVDVNPASHKFYPYWQKWFGKATPIAQPQIDLLLVDSSLELLSVELKYLRLGEDGRIDHPFYSGIDEALALLRFGFVCVSLWHCFDERIPIDIVRKYREGTSSLVEAIDLPVNYSALHVVRAEEKVQFREFLSDMSESERLPSLYGKSNPLHATGQAAKIQDFLRTALKIPRRQT
jgi:hypothetical protein